MGESVAGRVFSVLDAFAEGPDTLRLTDIARRTGLPLPTALRMVRELVAWGGLERATDGSYRLGTRIRALGAAAPCPRGLLDAALPALRQLSARTGGHADVAVESDGTALFLVSGERLPLHATAAGKVLLAAGLGNVRELTRHTPHTVIAPARLAAQLTAVRTAGLAAAHEEYRLGELAYAAPVLRDGTTVAAVTVTARTGTPAARLVTAVREAVTRMGKWPQAARTGHDQ
ncbi:IclR family transcriptional regulator C-terminal domain-containing protein [Streptomyces sp. NPDC047525]|uniref:IclR family transcriptional regulator n=1 Tax=Streptomyces sp. NPDC047525 TaxID=3155264 RepID=UPI0033FE6913